MDEQLDIDAARQRLKTLEDEAASIRKIIHEKDKKEGRRTIKPCPVCGEPMQPGVVMIRGTPLGFLFVAASYQHLFIRPDGTTFDQLVLKSRRKRPGARCSNCDTVLVFGDTGGSQGYWGIV